MSTQEDARQALAQQRQLAEQTQERLPKRAEAEVETPIATQADMAEAARETLARHRQQEEQVQEAMLKRSESEVGLDQSV